MLCWCWIWASRCTCFFCVFLTGAVKLNKIQYLMTIGYAIFHCGDIHNFFEVFYFETHYMGDQKTPATTADVLYSRQKIMYSFQYIQFRSNIPQMCGYDL